MSGRVVILNGAPRSGKSTIARAVQTSLEGQWMNLGVDAVMATTPEEWRPGIGLRPGGERPDLEPIVLDLYRALFASIAALARQGIDVVSDVGLHEGYSRPLHLLDEMAATLSSFEVVLVGVRCPIETIMARRNADRSGHYLAGAGIPEPVRRWQEAVHRPGLYDLEVDTSVMSGEDCAAEIAAAVHHPRSPSAVARLAGQY